MTAAVRRRQRAQSPWPGRADTAACATRISLRP